MILYAAGKLVAKGLLKPVNKHFHCYSLFPWQVRSKHCFTPLTVAIIELWIFFR